MNFLEIARARQSCRAYDEGRPVEPEKIAAMLEAAQLGGGATPVATAAPSAEADSSPPVGDATEPIGGPTETVEKTTEQNNSVTNGEEP